MSWLTILRKRENFRRAFANFEFDRVARFDGRDVRRLLKDAGIVRHRGKIEATINNARRAKTWSKSLARSRITSGASSRRASRPKKLTWAAETMADDGRFDGAVQGSRRRGWTFVGPTTMYAFMQAMGLVNDHLHGCAYRR